jgi:pre-rRNA-processing protein IPI3
MNEVVVITSSNDSGIALLDINTLSSVGTNFKSCIVESSNCHAVTALGGLSSYSGLGDQGSAGDYLAVAQAKKPLINIFVFGKPQPHMQCHTQEITTALSSDHKNTLLFGGTKSGRIYCWDYSSGLLLNSFQAHFKSIHKIIVHPLLPYSITCSEDGMVRVWDNASIVDCSIRSKTSKGIVPEHSYTPHTLPVRDVIVLGGLTTFRMATVSHDRTLIIYDLYAKQNCVKMSFPMALECLVSSTSGDMLFLGSFTGPIYIVDLSSAAVLNSLAHTEIAVVGNVHSELSNAVKDKANRHYSTLEGHTKAVNSMAFSLNNVLLVSVSEDCSCRVWDTVTRQCLRETKPFIKFPLTSVTVYILIHFSFYLQLLNYMCILCILCLDITKARKFRIDGK